jgi:hypothetical protein
MQQAAAEQTFIARFSRATGQLGVVAVLAMVCVFIGWFFTDTQTIASMGPLVHTVRFYGFADAIANPLRLFVGSEVTSATIAFSVVCIGCILAPLLPHWAGNRALWPAYCAPLLLIIVIGLTLYFRASHDLFSSSDDADAVSRDLVRLANDLVNKGGQLVARHVAIGLGGYLGIIGSVVLAVWGFRLVRPRDDLR